MQAELNRECDVQTGMGDYAHATKTATLKQALQSTNVDQELSKLLGRYPDAGDRFHVQCLTRLMREDEVEQYRAVLKLGTTQIVSRGKMAVR